MRFADSGAEPGLDVVKHPGALERQIGPGRHRLGGPLWLSSVTRCQGERVTEGDVEPNHLGDRTLMWTSPLWSV